MKVHGVKISPDPVVVNKPAKFKISASTGEIIISIIIIIIVSFYFVWSICLSRQHCEIYYSSVQLITSVLLCSFGYILSYGIVNYMIVLVYAIGGANIFFFFNYVYNFFFKYALGLSLHIKVDNEKSCIATNAWEHFIF